MPPNSPVITAGGSRVFAHAKFNHRGLTLVLTPIEPLHTHTSIQNNLWNLNKVISISNKNNWRKISKEKRPWSGQRSSIQFSRPLAQSIIHRLNWTRKIRGISGFSSFSRKIFSDKISENERPFSSRSEKTIPQFENRNLLENSR